MVLITAWLAFWLPFLIHPRAMMKAEAQDIVLIANYCQVDNFSLFFKSSSYKFSQKSRVRFLNRSFGYTGSEMHIKQQMRQTFQGPNVNMSDLDVCGQKIDLTILPRTSTPSDVILADAFIAFSPTCLQSITTLAKVLLTIMCSWVKVKMFQEVRNKKKQQPILHNCMTHH